MHVPMERALSRDMSLFSWIATGSSAQNDGTDIVTWPSSNPGCLISSNFPSSSRMEMGHLPTGTCDFGAAATSSALIPCRSSTAVSFLSFPRILSTRSLVFFTNPLIPLASPPGMFRKKMRHTTRYNTKIPAAMAITLTCPRDDLRAFDLSTLFLRMTLRSDRAAPRRLSALSLTSWMLPLPLPMLLGARPLPDEIFFFLDRASRPVLERGAAVSVVEFIALRTYALSSFCLWQ
mmetsp:Transcript_38046/g.91783  ORF Transcript_38046/g.91783 Transcript_38046/m.91783 type:complete len:234 (+) Transcript_38046:147-848(+)